MHRDDEAINEMNETGVPPWCYLCTHADDSRKNWRCMHEGPTRRLPLSELHVDYGPPEWCPIQAKIAANK